MDWIIKIVGILLLTSFTGSMGFLFWGISRLWLEKSGYWKLSCRLLQIVVLLHIFPFVYIVMICVNVYASRWSGVLFWTTEKILKVAYLFIAVWIVGVGIGITRYICALWKMKQCLKYRFSCEESKNIMFRKICWEMNIPPEKIQLSQCYQVHIPQITGVFSPQIVLPVEKFTDEQLYTILVHELTHYINKDLWIKRLMMGIVILQFYNPFVWILDGVVDRYSEYFCDAQASQKIGNVKIYFTVILEMEEKLGQMHLRFGLPLSGKKNELLKRVKHINVLNNQKKSKGILMILLVSGMMVFIVAMCFISDLIGTGYEKYYFATDTSVRIKKENSELPEYSEMITDSDIQMEENDPEPIAKTMNTYNWTVAKNSLKKTDSIYVEEGNIICIAVKISPFLSNVKIGLMDEKGYKSYVIGQEFIGHDFVINTSGNYCVFVENKNDVSATLELIVFYDNKTEEGEYNMAEVISTYTYPQGGMYNIYSLFIRISFLILLVLLQVLLYKAIRLISLSIKKYEREENRHCNK